MNSIQLLEKDIIDQIAAGEVVERPASVVKELLENAIDADATAVTVEIRDGGASLIRITDNGAGIPKEQVRLAFARHATSKIRRLEDLNEIVSLGFRGEALSSIAAVSRVELITRIPEALTGVRYCIEGGRETEFEEIGAPSGTTFLVRNLFYNTPARAKFMKSPQAEGNRVASVVEELALSHPDISFKFLMNGQSRLFTGGNGNLKEIVYQIYGREMASRLIPIEDTSDLLQIRGFLGDPEIARGNRNFENYFINGRYVKSQLIARAVEDGYHGFMMQHKYPFTLLYLTVRGDLVDVNVHPSKMEVRIQEQEAIYRQLTLAIQNVLFERERIPQLTFSNRAEEKKRKQEEEDRVRRNANAPEPFEAARRAADGTAASDKQMMHRAAEKLSEKQIPQETSGEVQEKQILQGAAGKQPLQVPMGQTAGQEAPEQVQEKPAVYGRQAEQLPPGPEQQRVSDPKQQRVSGPKQQRVSGSGQQRVSASEQQELFPEKLLEQASVPMHRMIGQLFATYWLIEFNDALYIVDQHAAHEKVLYERLMSAYRKKAVHSQMIMPAVVRTLTAAEQTVLEKHMEQFRALGYEIEPFGGSEIRITAVPDNLYKIASDELFTGLLDQLSDTGDQDPVRVTERIASMSCRAAVKGNHRMSVQEAEALIRELLTLDNPYNCPHGRPTIISMSHYELDKRFKRIL